MNYFRRSYLLALFILLRCSLAFAIEYGSLNINGQPHDGALHIFIDGAEMVSSSPWPFEAGTHEYRLTRPGYYSLQGQVDIKADKSVTINYHLEPKTLGAKTFFANIPYYLQERGRWLSIMPISMGFMAGDGGEVLSDLGLAVGFAGLTIYSPKPYLPIMLGLVPVQLSFHSVMVGGGEGEITKKSFSLSAVRSKIFVGAYWCGYHLLVSLGAQSWIGGQIFPSYTIKAGGGLFAQFGLLLSNRFVLDLRYDIDISKKPSHTLQLGWQINIYGKHRR